LFVRATEPDPTSQDHDVFAVDGNLEVLARALAMIRRAGSHGPNESHHAESGEEHLDLSREALAFGGGVDTIIANRSIPVQVRLNECGDLQIRTSKEDLGNGFS
jgi:hypothetical protein